MFREVTIIFLSQNINLSPSYTQFCQGQKKVVVRFPLFSRLDHRHSKIQTGFSNKMY